MKAGDRVRTEVALPGISAGKRGVITEVGRLFIVVAFDDGRHGYYARRQLTLDAPLDEDDLSSDGLVPLGLADASVRRGSHLCLLPSNGGVAVNIVARYAAAGLACHECALCILPDTWQRPFLRSPALRRVDSATALRSGRLSILSTEKVYQSPATFVARDQLERTATAVSRARDGGSDGIRLFGCIGQTATADGWWEYEERITPILKAFGATTLCVYDQDGLTPEREQKAALLHTHVLRDGRLTLGGLRTH